MNLSTIQERLGRDFFGKDDLDQMSQGTFLYPDSPQLPSQSGMGWRLFDQVHVVSRNDESAGEVRGFGRISPKHIIFSDHFPNYKVLPGLFMTDQLLQLAGLLIGLHGVRGQGLAISLGATKFYAPATPDIGLVTFVVTGTKLLRGPKQTKLWANGEWRFGDVRGGIAEDLHVKVIHPN